MMKNEYRNWLLSNYDFIQNEHFDAYLDLVCNYDRTTPGYRELHHLLPVAFYKERFGCRSRAEALKIADADLNNIKINLYTKIIAELIGYCIFALQIS